ncbi:TMV resistance protein N-like isoform X2 [Rosa rugosa]|uniref:TMV resistance protein N-like isoform X2 n=1 Tax=Rosa rugosa TaxID=74645 RepID=UPI002B40FE59|nr:TMV resistance protein N-like isoform X2 [Rosa rugosa]
MASSSSSSSGARCKYDVFLSFRGADTRKIFVGHLYRALKQKTINTFIDSEELSKGNKISELLTAIEDSRISIVVFSQKYASSTWCLKELVKILDCMDTKKQIVVPIFYEVDPSDLRKINGKFAEAFAKHGENSNLDNEELESWRSAVNRVADLSGWDSTKYEDDGKLVEEIVENTLKKLIHTSSNKADGLVGMDSHITEMNSRLCIQVNDVRVVGIWGMGGLGKTTIARAVFDEIACQFEHSCFLDNVKEAFINKREVQMQEALISILLKEKVQSLGLNRGWNMIKERLGLKKVLVVLDDVETFAQIEALLGKLHAFGEGSRLIVTTRNKQSLSGVNETFKPSYLRDDEALELFRKYAFRTNQPNRDYDHLSRRAIEYAQGLPLALKVLGAFLDNKSVCEWEVVLEKLKKIPHIEIQDVLRTSFDGLDDSEKNIFLDIACLFRKWRTNFVTELLDSFGFFPHNGLRVLVDRALITSSNYRVDMHDLLQEMGREIVRLESTKKPGKRSRLWSYKDVNHVLTQNTATDAIECLMLDLSNSKVDLSINAEAFVRMTKLRLLIICYSFPVYLFPYSECRKNICPVGGCKQLLRGDFEFLSHELRFLLWHGCPVKCLPSSFIPKNLVHLDMRGSHIRELWEGIKPLQNLRVIKLSHCRYLVKIPDLTEAINLETLLLDGCSSLFEVHSSISALQNLHLLDLTGCKILKILPKRIHMKSLQTLCLSGCSNLEKFPEISGIMKELSMLRLDGTAIKGLPSSIDLLLRIKKLSVRNCKSLEFLPDSICNLANLTHMNLSGCSVLHYLPEKLGDLESLEVLDVGYSGIKQLPFSVLRLGKLKGGLSCIGCKKMTAPLSAWPSSIEEYCSYSVLLRLDLSDCNLLELSDGIAHLYSLKTLRLCRNKLESLPVTVNRLRCLTHLELEACKRLKSVPELSSSVIRIDAHDCTALETVSRRKTDPVCRILDFRFSNCFRLQANLFIDIVETETYSLDQSSATSVVPHVASWK